ncbi:MAG: hypothetical protein IKE43_09645 [Coriobacteriales bacterium]|nr:hypothetical protein [Coriobacteriales bacterium]
MSTSCSTEVSNVQLNVRMSRELRDRGNAVLLGCGINPSEFVRAIWQKITKRGEDLDRIIDAVYSQEPASKEVLEIDESDSLVPGARLFETYLQAVGIHTDATGIIHRDNRSYDELLEEARADHYSEKGFLHE